MELFGTSSGILFDFNLIVQLFLMVLLAFGSYVMKTKHQMKNHGVIMATGTSINLVMVLLVMGPSLIRNWGAIVADPTNLGAIVTLAHVAMGLIALVGGVLFSFRFVSASRSGGKLACGKRPSMRAVMALWMLGLLLGLGFYTYYYVLA